MENVVYLNAYKDAEVYVKNFLEAYPPRFLSKEDSKIVRDIAYNAFIDGYKAGVERMKNQVVNIVVPGNKL